MRLPGIQFSSQQVRQSNAPLPSIESAGAAFGAMADFGKQLYRDKIESQEREQRSQFEEQASNFALQEQERMSQMKIERERNPNNFTKDYLKSFDEQYEKSIPENSSEFQRQLYQENKLRVRDSMAKSAMRFESSQKAKMQKERIAVAEQSTINLIQRDLNQYNAALSNLERLHGADTPAFQNAKNKMVRTATDVYLSQDKLSDAETFLENNAESFGDDYLKYKLKIESLENEIESEAEAKHDKFMQGLLDSAELDYIEGTMTPEKEMMYSSFLDYSEDKLEFAKIKKRSTNKTDPDTFFYYSDRISAGEDVRDQIKQDTRLSLADKKSLIEDYDEDTYDPVKAGESLIKDSLPNEVLQNPQLSVQKGLALNNYRRRINELPPAGRTEETARNIAVEELSKIEDKFVKSVLRGAGVVSASPQQLLNEKKQEMERLVNTTFNGDVSAARNDHKFLKLKSEIQALTIQVNNGR